MKKLIVLFFMFSLSSCVFAQDIQTITTKQNNKKGGFVVAAIGVLAGSVIGLAANHQEAPKYNNSISVADNEKEMQGFNKRKSNLYNASYCCFAVAGTGLIVGFIIKF